MKMNASEIYEHHNSQPKVLTKYGLRVICGQMEVDGKTYYAYIKTADDRQREEKTSSF